MQAVDQRSGNPAAGLWMRVMAGFGTLVAVILIAIAIVYGAVLVQGALVERNTTNPTSISAPANQAFRAGERAVLSSSVSAASLQNQFRAGERGDGSVSAASLQNQFRAGERAVLSTSVSAASLQNQFRGGERGDPASR